MNSVTTYKRSYFSIEHKNIERNKLSLIEEKKLEEIQK